MNLRDGFSITFARNCFERGLLTAISAFAKLPIAKVDGRYGLNGGV
jgi:hypothetical protein